MKFSEASAFLKSLGLDNNQFTVSEDIENIELYKNLKYLCSIGRWDAQSFEVFELHHGAEISADEKSWTTDGELWQYNVYASLKRAIRKAIGYLQSGRLPEKAIRKW